MKTVQKYMAECLVCQKHKYETNSPARLLQPLPIPGRVWEDISMDFITRLPKSQSHDAILAVVDRFTNYGHFLPLSYPYSAKTVAAVFIKEVVRLHRIPKSIVNDRDSIFFSNFWKKLFRLQGTWLNMSTTYHPETNGNIEVLNRGLETYLRCFASEQLKQWCSWLHWTEYWYNTS